MAIDPGLRGRVALVTGANQGIGAAAARSLAAQGCAVFLTYLRLGPDDPGVLVTALPAYAMARERTADTVVAAIMGAGGRAAVWETDLAEPATIPELFDRAEAALGPIEILVNNADAWLGDTFLPDATDRDRFARRLLAVTAEGHDHSFRVNSRATALLLAAAEQP